MQSTAGSGRVKTQRRFLNALEGFSSRRRRARRPRHLAVVERHATAPSVDSLPTLQGELSLYLGRGEGGLYEDVLTAIAQRNPDFTLNTRRGPNAALANAIIAESNADVRRADVFWAVDTGAIGVISEAGLAHDLPTALTDQLQPEFRYKNWVPVSGRIRTVPFFTQRLVAKDIPTSIMAIPDSGLRMGWAPRARPSSRPSNLSLELSPDVALPQDSSWEV